MKTSTLFTLDTLKDTKFTANLTKTTIYAVLSKQVLSLASKMFKIIKQIVNKKIVFYHILSNTATLPRQGSIGRYVTFGHRFDPRVANEIFFLWRLAASRSLITKTAHPIR